MSHQAILINQSSRNLYLSSESVKQYEVLTITAIALAGIAMITIGVLSHFSIISGMNAATHWSLIGAGSTATLASFAATCVIACRLRKQAEDLSALSLEELQTKIEKILEQEGDLMAGVESLAKGIPLERLEALIHEKYPSFSDAMRAARGMLGQARAYLEARETLSPSLKTRLRDILDKLLTAFDSIFSAFGIASFFQESAGRYDGDFKLQKIMMLMSLFTLLTATLLPMLGVTTGASIVGGIILLVAVMSVAWPYIRPLPSRIKEGENWSQQMRGGLLGNAQGRETALDQIASALISKRHPLLIGPSGVGKTQTVKAFTQALEQGKYPQLIGKTVYYFNTANLVQSREMFGGGNRILKSISETIDRHRDECILVFDEIHLAYQDGKNSSLGEQLKTLLDDKEGNFPFFIGLTTEEEYYRDIYKENSAGDRRFEKIEISGTDDNGTLGILNRQLVEKAPSVLIDDGALEYLVEQTQGRLQPLTALNLLMSCLSKTTNYATSTSKTVGDKQDELEHLYLRSAALGSRSIEKEAEMAQRIEELEQELLELNDRIEGEKRNFEVVERLRDQLVQIRAVKHQSVFQVANLEPEALDEKSANVFLLLKYFLEEALEKRLEEVCRGAGVTAVIDRDLIDRVLEEEKTNIQKRKNALERARKTRNARDSV